MMADETEQAQENEEQAQAATGGGGRGLIIAFVAVVVLMETAMFFFLIPTADEVSALAEDRLIHSVQQSEEEAAQQILNENEHIEFDMGMYGETFSPTDTERRFRVEIDLYGLVFKKNGDRMGAEFDAKKGRLRHAIRSKIRNSKLSELEENNLGLLERRILTTSNHLLADDLLLGVGFNSYQLIEE